MGTELRIPLRVRGMSLRAINSTSSGYNFAALAGGGPPAVRYCATAVPVALNRTGVRSFCTFENAAVRMQPTGAAIDSQTG
jgi:hypothetical protein